MSEAAETIEITQAPGVTVNAPAKPLTTTKARKRSVAQFLNQYRGLGLPNAKRFRRRTKLAQAKHEHAVDVGVIQGLIRQLSAYMKAFDVLKREDNWAVRGEEVVWIGDGDPLEIIRNAEKQTD